MKHSALFLSAMIAFLLASGSATAVEVQLQYFEVRDARVADAIDQLDEKFDEREEPLKDRRREAPYGSEAHAQLSAELDSLRAERDAAFLDLLKNTPPVVDYRGEADPGETLTDTGEYQGKPLEVSMGFLAVDGDSIPVEIHAEYGGRTLYKGSPLLLPFGKPFLVAKALAKIQGERQGTLLFVRVDR